ncbi:MAG: hypothetical protein WAZ15_11305, partial [Propioniciclava sp.]
MAENRSDEQGAPGDDWSPAAATTPSVSPSSPTPASPAPATETPQDLLTTDPAVSAEHDRLVAERAARR